MSCSTFDCVTLCSFDCLSPICLFVIFIHIGLSLFIYCLFYKIHTSMFPNYLLLLFYLFFWCRLKWIGFGMDRSFSHCRSIVQCVLSCCRLFHDVKFFRFGLTFRISVRWWALGLPVATILSLVDVRTGTITWVSMVGIG